MIHPAALNSKNKFSLTNKKLIVYYVAALLLNCLNFVPAIRSKYQNETSPDISQGAQDWFRQSFVLSIPLVFEFCLDTVVYFLNPSYYQNMIDHRFGHGLLLLSLALPAVVVFFESRNSDINTILSVCLVESLCALALTAIYGKLQVYSDGMWKGSYSLLIILVFLVSQMTLNFGVADCRNSFECLNGMDNSKVIVGIVFSIVALLLHLYSSRNELANVMGVIIGDNNRVFSTNQYQCAVLVFIVSGYFACRIVLLGVYLTNDYDLATLEDTQEGLHIAFTLCAAVLPGRMINRGIAALKREMDNKKTFIRYISHEIRSPLATTSLGLDYLIAQMSANQMTLEEVLDVVKDAKVTCEIATNTLNDLLMFDKIETGMLELATTELDAWEFVHDSVKPFQLQATSQGIKLQCKNLLSDTVLPVLPNNSCPILTIPSEDSSSPSPRSETSCQTADSLHCTIKIDKYKMDQVVRNFLTNALKFTPQHSIGCITVNIKLLNHYTDVPASEATTVKLTNKPKTRSGNTNNGNSKHEKGLTSGSENTERGLAYAHPSQPHAGVLRIEVIDNGPGISADNLPKLFGQYVQFDANTLQGGKGSGLGLWLSKAIVEMHGGVIGATSPGAGQGCTFYLEIPCTAFEPTTSSSNSDSRSPQYGVSFSKSFNNKSFSTSDEVQTQIGTSTRFGSSQYTNLNSATSEDQDDERLIEDTKIRKIGTFNTNNSNDRNGNSNFSIDNILEIESVDGSAKYITSSSNNNSYKSNFKVDNNTVDAVAFDNIVTVGDVMQKTASYEQLIQSDHSSKNTNTNSPKNKALSLNNTNNSEPVSRTSSHKQLTGTTDNIPSSPISPLSPHKTKKTTTASANNTAKKKAIDRSVLTNLRVLLVDDSTIARKMVDRTLSAAGVTCYHANNGAEAVQLVTQSLQNPELGLKYDAILMDCYMPVMNGPEAVRYIRGTACGYSGVIFALSGSSEDGEFAPLLGQGVDRILVKPFNLDAFCVAFNELKTF